MQNRHRLFLFIALIAIAVVVLVGIRYTANPDSATTLSVRRNRSIPEQESWISQRGLETARGFSRMDNTRDEDRLARQAVDLADQDVDLAFSTALRDARIHPSAAGPKTKEIRKRIDEFQAEIRANQARVLQLTAALNGPKVKDPDALQRQLDLAQAQLTLYTEEVEDAKQDLSRVGEDVESRIQRMLDMHRASQHSADAASQQTSPASKPAFQVPGSMFDQFRLLRSLRQKREALVGAQQGVQALSQTIDRRHDDLEQELKQASQVVRDPDANDVRQGQIEAVERLSEQRKTLADYDRRVDTEQQLAQAYGNWSALLTARQTATVHKILYGVLWILLIIIAVQIVDAVVDRILARRNSDRRRTMTVRMIARFGTRFIAAMLALFVIFGPPNQLTTIIGLATAGLTVALKDFIVAFFGWFVLMGKNGIRVGDWVEVNGISGEVVEIGLLRTVLLETGKWGDSAHPTGRRVTFVNSFAIEGHYFNFSTSGQWLWDTLDITVPSGQDPFPITDAILRAVTQQTEGGTQQAEQDWQKVTHKYGLQNFSAAPTIAVRPTSQGVEIVVRYITRANERYNLRSKLYQTVVELIHHRNVEPRIKSAVPGND